MCHLSIKIHSKSLFCFSKLCIRGGGIPGPPPPAMHGSKPKILLGQLVEKIIRPQTLIVRVPGGFLKNNRIKSKTFLNCGLTVGQTSKLLYGFLIKHSEIL